MFKKYSWRGRGGTNLVQHNTAISIGLDIYQVHKKHMVQMYTYVHPIKFNIKKKTKFDFFIKCLFTQLDMRMYKDWSLNIRTLESSLKINELLPSLICRSLLCLSILIIWACTLFFFTWHGHVFRVWVLGGGGHGLYRAGSLIARLWGAGDGTKTWYSGLGAKRDNRVIVLDFCTPTRGLKRWFPQTLSLNILPDRGRERKGCVLEKSEEQICHP